jgi:hypothetical protein
MERLLLPTKPQEEVTAFPTFLLKSSTESENEWENGEVERQLEVISIYDKWIQ